MKHLLNMKKNGWFWFFVLLGKYIFYLKKVLFYFRKFSLWEHFWTFYVSVMYIDVHETKFIVMMKSHKKLLLLRLWTDFCQNCWHDFRKLGPSRMDWNCLRSCVVDSVLSFGWQNYWRPFLSYIYIRPFDM